MYFCRNFRGKLEFKFMPSGRGGYVINIIKQIGYKEKAA